MEDFLYLAVIIYPAFCVIGAILYGMRHTIARTLLQVGLHYAGSPIARLNGFVADARTAFRQAAIVDTTRENRYAPHWHEADERAKAFQLAQAMAAPLGLEVRDHQKSKPHAQNGVPGQRSVHWTNDLSIDVPLADRFATFYGDSKTLVYVADVTYYIEDLEDILANNRYGVPIVLYVISPTTACGVDKATSWTWTKEQEIKVNITGCAEFQHRLWDFNVDTLFCRTWALSTPFLRGVQYSVERKQLGQHQLICLAATWVSSNSLVGLVQFLHPKPLTRMAPVDPDGNIYIHYKGQDEVDGETVHYHNVSVGLAGDHTGVTLPVSLMNALMLSNRGLKFQTSSVRTYLSGAQTEGCIDVVPTRAQCTLLANVLNAKVRDTWVTIPAKLHIVRPRTLPGVVQLDEPTTRMEAHVSPFVDQAFVPEATTAATAQATVARTLNIAADSVVTPFMRGFAKEYAVGLVPEGGFLMPVDREEVYEKQCSRSQRSQIEQWEFGVAKEILGNFDKLEAYPEAKDFRGISNIKGAGKVEYARYMYAVANWLKTQPWYGFGKNPEQIADHIVEIASGASKDNPMGEADANRMDGRIIAIVRLIEEEVCRRLFHPSEVPRLIELMRQQHNRKGRFFSEDNLYQYITYWARLSGSAETSNFNSLLSHCCYVLHLILKGLSMNEALDVADEHFMAAGDDTVGTHMDPEVYAEAGGLLGMKMKILIREPGTAFSFLNRFYPFAGDGNPASYVDIMRMLGKFHCGRKAAILDFVFYRWIALVSNDAHTPILSEVRAAYGHVLTLFEYTQPLSKDPNTAKNYVPYFMGWPSVSHRKDDIEAFEDVINSSLAAKGIELDVGALRRWRKSVEQETDPEMALELLKNSPLLLMPPAPHATDTDQVQEYVADVPEIGKLEPVHVKRVKGKFELQPDPDTVGAATYKQAEEMGKAFRFDAPDPNKDLLDFRDEVLAPVGSLGFLPWQAKAQLIKDGYSRPVFGVEMAPYKMPFYDPVNEELYWDYDDMCPRTRPKRTNLAWAPGSHKALDPFCTCGCRNPDGTHVSSVMTMENYQIALNQKMMQEAEEADDPERPDTVLEEPDIPVAPVLEVVPKQPEVAKQAAAKPKGSKAKTKAKKTGAKGGSKPGPGGTGGKRRQRKSANKGPGSKPPG